MSQYPGELTDERKFYLRQKYGYLVSPDYPRPYPGLPTAEEDFMAHQKYGWIFDRSMPPPYLGEITDEEKFRLRQKYPEVVEFWEAMYKKFDREKREQEILDDLDRLFFIWDLIPSSRLMFWQKIVMNAMCLKPGTEVDTDLVKKIGDRKYFPHSLVDDAVKYFGRFPFDPDKMPAPIKPAPERWKDSAEAQRLPPELSRIVQCFLDGSDEEILSQALCRAILNAKNTRLLIRSRLDTPSLAGAPVECEFSLRSFFDEYEEPLLYAIFGDTRITFHAIKTGPNTASVTLKFRHSFEWKDIRRNDLEKFFDTPQEMGRWSGRSTKLVGEVFDDNYELELPKTIQLKFSSDASSSGEVPGETGSDTGNPFSIIPGLAAAGELAENFLRNKLGSLLKERAVQVADASGQAHAFLGAGAVQPEPQDKAKPVSLPPPNPENLSGGLENLENVIFAKFLAGDQTLIVSAAFMELFRKSVALESWITARPPEAAGVEYTPKPRRARIVFEEDKDPELYRAFGEVIIWYSYYPFKEEEQQLNVARDQNGMLKPVNSQRQQQIGPSLDLWLEISHEWKWADLERNNFDKLLSPELQDKHKRSRISVTGYAVLKDYFSVSNKLPKKEVDQKAQSHSLSFSENSLLGHLFAKYMSGESIYILNDQEMEMLLKSPSIKKKLESLPKDNEGEPSPDVLSAWHTVKFDKSTDPELYDAFGETNVKFSGDSQIPLSEFRHHWSQKDILRNQLEQCLDLGMTYTMPVTAYFLKKLRWKKEGTSINDLIEERKVISRAAKAVLEGTPQVDVTKIPDVMNAQKLENAAVLMRRWLDSTGETDTTTIKMDWALKYDRARDVYYKIINDKLYIKEKVAKKEIIKLAKKYGAYENGGKFGCVNGDPLTLDADSTQYVAVSANFTDVIMDPIDDLFASLGAFTIKILVEGDVRKIESKGKTSRIFTVSKIGLYIKDSYNFNDKHFNAEQLSSWMSQPLGFWNTNNDTVGKTPLGGKYVDNETFRDYTKRTGKGKNFMIYSDIKIPEIQIHDEFSEEEAK